MKGDPNEESPQTEQKRKKEKERPNEVSVNRRR